MDFLFANVGMQWVQNIRSILKRQGFLLTKKSISVEKKSINGEGQKRAGASTQKH